MLYLCSLNWSKLTEINIALLNHFMFYETYIVNDKIICNNFPGDLTAGLQ